MENKHGPVSSQYPMSEALHLNAAAPQKANKSFTMSGTVTGIGNLANLEFIVDGVVVGQMSSCPPYHLSFK